MVGPRPKDRGVLFSPLSHNVMADPNSGCWLWVGPCDKNGYGKAAEKGSVHNRPRTVRAHRRSYEVNRGAIPERLHVLHRCDTPACVNPDHLFLGTNMDNVRDMVSKGRQPRGEGGGRAKLTEADAKAIFWDTRSQENIASEYGINQTTVSRIKLRQLWSHIPMGA